MKKLFYVSLALLILVSCSRDFDEYEEATTDISIMAISLENDILAPLLTSDVSFITLENGMKMMEIDTMLVAQGDIILTEEQIACLKNPESRGSVMDDYTKEWPYGIVFYEVLPNAGYTTPDRDVVRSYLDYLESKTNLRFWERSSMYNNYISIVGYENNLSYIGMIGGKQLLRLYNVSALPHEMLHAVGFGHEQGRRDRDQYITIEWDNIISKWQYAFDYNHLNNQPMFDDGAFDFSSLMLYSSYNSFAIDATKPTMTKKDGSVFYPNYSTLSAGDIAMVNKKYPSAYSYDILPVTLSTGNESGNGWQENYSIIGFIARKPVAEDTRIGINIYRYQYDGYGYEYENSWTSHVTIPKGSRTVEYKFTEQYFSSGGEIDEWTTSNYHITGYDFPEIP